MLLRPFRTRWSLVGLLALALLSLPSVLPADDRLVFTVEAADEATALAAGLEQALVRVAGLRSPEVRELAQRLLLERDADGRIPALREGVPQEEGRFRLEFDRQPLRVALRDAGVPVVLGARPALLVWAVHEDAGQRQLLGSGVDRSGVLAALERLAEERGQPLMLPLADLEDRRAVHAGDVVGGVTDPLAVAGRRYGADGLVALYVRTTAEGAVARAVLAHDGREHRSEARGESTDEAARLALDRGLDRLLQRLARVPDEPEWVALGFTGVRGFAAFRELQAELTRLDAIDAARLESLRGDAVTVEVQAAVDPEALVELLRAAGYARGEAPFDDSDVEAWLRR